MCSLSQVNQHQHQQHQCCSTNWATIGHNTQPALIQMGLLRWLHAYIYSGQYFFLHFFAICTCICKCHDSIDSFCPFCRRYKCTCTHTHTHACTHMQHTCNTVANKLRVQLMQIRVTNELRVQLIQTMSTGSVLPHRDIPHWLIVPTL